MPRSVFVIGDKYKSDMFISKWLKRYNKKNNTDVERFVYRYEPLGKKEYHNIKIAIFNKINKLEKEFDLDILRRNIKIEIAKLKKYNPNITIIMTTSKPTYFYDNIAKKNNMLYLVLYDSEDLENFKIRESFINRKLDGLVNALRMN